MVEREIYLDFGVPSEAFICKAFNDEAIGTYAEPLITQQMKVSGSPAG